MFMYRHDVIYELKGVKIMNYNVQLEDIHMNDIPINRSAGTINHGASENCIPSADVDYMSSQNSILCTQESFIYIYSICFSTIMACAYWTYETQTAIIESAIDIYNATLNYKDQSVLDHFPPSITICGPKIDISYTSRHEGALCRTSLSSKLSLESVIMANAVQNKGFVIWLSNYCFACIVHKQVYRKREKTKYFIVSSDETRKLNLFKELANAYLVVNRFCDILDFNNIEEQEVKYTLQFVSTTSTLTNLERKKVLREHFKMNALKYKEMDQDKKNELSKKNSLKYKNMDSLKKKVLNEKKSVKYHAMDPCEKKVLLEKQSISYKQMETSAKKACLQRKRSSMKCKYNAIDSPEKAKKRTTKSNLLNMT